MQMVDAVMPCLASVIHQLSTEEARASSEELTMFADSIAAVDLFYGDQVYASVKRIILGAGQCRPVQGGTVISSMDQEMEVSHCLVSHTTKHNAKSDATMGTTQKGRTNALAEHQQMELCTGATLPHLVKR